MSIARLNQVGARPATKAIFATLALLGATGCRRAPSYSILGSFFPVWIFCFVAGILLSFLIHTLLGRRGLGNLLSPALLVYPSLTVLFTLTLWLLFYS